MADNLAETVMQATQTTTGATPTAAYGGPAFVDASPPGEGVLSETCSSLTSLWPDGCDTTAGKFWLPGKGIFLRATYCLSRDLTEAGLSDTGIGTFITSNATSVWDKDQNSGFGAGDLHANQFGFLWDNDDFSSSNTNWEPAGGGDQPGLGYVTQASALEALGAQIAGSTAMCDGHLT